jgi:hypothetical protein
LSQNSYGTTTPPAPAPPPPANQQQPTRMKVPMFIMNLNLLALVMVAVALWMFLLALLLLCFRKVLVMQMTMQTLHIPHMIMLSSPHLQDCLSPDETCKAKFSHFDFPHFTKRPGAQPPSANHN